MKQIWGETLHLLHQVVFFSSHDIPSAQLVGDVTPYWIKPGQHPVKIHVQLTPRPIVRVLSTHSIPPSILKLSSEALPISTLPNSGPDNPPSESFLGDYQSRQCLGWERFLARL